MQGRTDVKKVRDSNHRQQFGANQRRKKAWRSRWFCEKVYCRQFVGVQWRNGRWIARKTNKLMSLSLTLCSWQSPSVTGQVGRMGERFFWLYCFYLKLHGHLLHFFIHCQSLNLLRENGPKKCRTYLVSLSWCHFRPYGTFGFIGDNHIPHCNYHCLYHSRCLP